MYSKLDQNIIDTLMRFKVEEGTDNSTIASIIPKPHEERTKHERDGLAVYMLNKIATAATAEINTTTRSKGEVSEPMGYLSSRRSTRLVI